MHNDKSQSLVVSVHAKGSTKWSESRCPLSIIHIIETEWYCYVTLMLMLMLMLMQTWPRYVTPTLSSTSTSVHKPLSALYISLTSSLALGFPLETKMPYKYIRVFSCMQKLFLLLLLLFLPLLLSFLHLSVFPLCLSVSLSLFLTLSLSLSLFLPLFNESKVNAGIKLHVEIFLVFKITKDAFLKFLLLTLLFLHLTIWVLRSKRNLR